MKNYKEYFENAGVAFLILDEKGMIQDANLQFEKMAGFNKENAIGKWFIYDLVQEKDRNALRQIFDSGFRNITLPTQFSCHFVTKKKKLKPVLFTLNLLPNKKQIILTITDVMLVKKEEAYKQKSSLQKEIEKIASGLGHEIRNHLSAINTSIEVLRDSMLVTDEDEELMNIILEENKALNEIVKEFAFYAKINEPDISLIDINDMLSEVVEYEQQNAPPNITIVKNLSESAPPFYADRAQLKTVFFNIIENAIEAMPEGGVLEISTAIVKNELDEDVIEFVFSDSGEGIMKDDLANVFKPFFSNKDNHSGMGLPISQRIIEKHKGTIQIESNQEKGTKVIIRIPFLADTMIKEKLPGLL